jgi:hypothetical protein
MMPQLWVAWAALYLNHSFVSGTRQAKYLPGIACQSVSSRACQPCRALYREQTDAESRVIA